MVRRRLAVALLVPQPLATEVDGLRRACGDPRRGRIPAHVTLVPPVNVADAQVSDVLATCRTAAAATPVLHLTLGAPSTFAPATPLAWLTVGGDLDALATLRRRLDVGALARPADHPFVPHVTISSTVDPDRLGALLAALTDFDAACVIDRTVVLENRQLSDGRWGWVPIADAPFGRPATVGAGGLALELSVSEVLDPEAEALIAASGDRARDALIVVARRGGMVVGVALGATHDGVAVLDDLTVADGVRRQGIGSHLLARFTAEAVLRGCNTARHTAGRPDPVLDLCRQRGWTAAGQGGPADPVTLVRYLTGS